MSEGETQGFTEAERAVKRTSGREHPNEFNLMVNLCNVYITGFNLIGSFTLNEDTEVEHAWLMLLLRSHHSMRCALLLMSAGYYGQTIALLRGITEDWLKCKDCSGYRPTLDALLYDEDGFGDSKLKLRAIDMARRVGVEQVYYDDYRSECRFVHASRLSLRINKDPDTGEARGAPVYDEMLFMACCELFIRNALRMAEFMEKFLLRVVKDGVSTWQEFASEHCKEAADWLDSIRLDFAE